MWENWIEWENIALEFDQIVSDMSDKDRHDVLLLYLMWSENFVYLC